MSSPIVVDGTTTFIPVNTKLYTGDITVQVPPLDLGGRLITVLDTGGQASPSKRILITPITGASFENGVPFYPITTPNGSLSFSQVSLSVYTIPQTIISGNTNSSLPQIIISTPHTIISTVASQSSLVVTNNLAVKNLFLGGPVYALGGFQPTVNNPYVIIDYLSAITVSTASISVGNIVSGGGLQTLNIIASSIIVSSQYASLSISARSNAYAVSTQNAGLVVNGLSLYSDNSNLYLGPYQLNSEIHTLVPAYNSSMIGLISTLIVGPGVSTLSTSISLISTLYNPNPGFSTLSTYNATRIPFISGLPTSTLFSNVKASLSTTAAQTGLSSISSLISYGLSSLALPFNLSSLSTTVSEGLSSVFEGPSISTLQFALQQGLSSVNQNFGIDDLTVKTKGILSTISTQSLLMSTLSTSFGYGSNYVNIGLYTSSFYGAASTSFNRLRIENTLSSFSTTLEYAVSNVDYFRGLSSLSTTIGRGFQPIDVRLQVSTVSTAIAQGLSSVSFFALQMSSLSTVIVGQISTLFDSGISTLSNVISRGASTVMAGPGISSLGLLASTSFRNIGAFIGLSSLSTTFTLGVSTVILAITPSSSIEFSTLYTSSISLLNTATNYGNILANSGEFTVNDHAINPPDNNFEGTSSISTYSLFVGSTFTTFNTLYPSSLTILNFLTTSSLLTETALTESTITGILNIRDSVTTSVNEIRATGFDLLINGKSVFVTANPGLSSLSSVISFQLSSISTFVNTMDAISTGLSTLALTLPRICTLSTLFGVRYIVPDNISTGISTIDSYISTMRVSTLNVTNFSLWSTFASTVTTSTLVVDVVSSYTLNPSLRNSFFIASTVFASSISISSFLPTVQVSSISSLGLTFGSLNAQNIDANSFFASSINANTLYASSFFLRDRGASYSVNRPLEFSTFYPLYGSNGALVYNSTIYSGGLTTSVFQNFFSTNFLTVSTVQATTAVYTSTLQFTGKVQFDRLVVMQSTLTPYFYATEYGFFGDHTVNTNQYNGRLYRSADGISWSQVEPTPGCWVGRGGTDTGYEGSYYYKIAWNGTYLLAYDCGRSNLTQTPTNYKNNNAISYDGGNTWTNVPRCADAVCLTEQAKIFWDGEKWFKFNVQSNAGTESVTTVSFDGIRWQNYTWNQTDAGSLSQLMTNQTSPIASVEYNGTTLIAGAMNTYGAPVASNFAFSDDLMNARPLNNTNSNFGFSLGGGGSDFNIGANIWSDGYAWWIPNHVNAVYGSICRIYPYRSNVIGIAPTDTGGYNRYCVGVGFPSAFIGTANGYISGGCYNGQMHVATVLVSGGAPLVSSLSILYSYDGIFWFRNPSTQGPNANTYKPIYAMDKWLVNATGSFTTTPTGASIFYSYDGLNWAPTIGAPPTTSFASFNAFSRGGCGDIMFMSNIKPSLDFNGVRIYNQPSGFSWQNPVSREQNIVAFQSSIMLHNSVYLSMDTSPSSILNGTGICVGIRNVKPSTTLDLGPTATLTAERLVISSLYVLPYRLSNGIVMYPSTSAIGSLKTERFLPLSTFNFYVHGSTFMKSLAVNVPNPVTVLDISGANPLFRSQDGQSDSAAAAYLTNIAQPTAQGSNIILGPGVQNNSTGMSIYYRSGGTNYKKSYGGSNFFTGQHATICLDLSGAVMSNVVSTVTFDENGDENVSYSTITTDYTGFLLSSADEGYISIPKQNTTLFGSNAINIIEALPKTRITRRDKDPAVFGVVTNNASTEFNADGTWTLDSDPLWGTCLWGRVRVNSIGEGALWVTNINGNISNGDYLCSSEIPGYSRKQDEDGMYNFTVAKATMSCDFDLNSSNYRCEEITYNGSTYKRAFIGVTYHCG